MQKLPVIDLTEIPRTRKTGSRTELRQFLIKDARFFEDQAQTWVKDTAKTAHKEIVDAGNPTFTEVSIDGTTGNTGRQRSGFAPGTIETAHRSVRIRYIGQALADLANSLRPILTNAIRQRFPNSRLSRLERDWVWYVARDGLVADGGRAVPELLGGSVNVPIDLYDVLFLVPEGAEPASYAWHALHESVVNEDVGKRLRRRRGEKKTAGYKDRRGSINRRLGYLGSAVMRMRARKIPGISIRGIAIEKGLTAHFSKFRKKSLIPAVRVAFYPRILQAVGVDI